MLPGSSCLFFEKKYNGTILNISSTSGLPTGGHPNECAYIASKFGVTGFTHALKKNSKMKKQISACLDFIQEG